MGLAERPLALTLGDPAGIGPDITLLAWKARTRESIPPFVLLGDAAVLAGRADALGLSVAIGEVADASDAIGVFADALPVLPVPVAGAVIAGHPDQEAMPAVQQSIVRAVSLAVQGAARAVVTNPISKATLYRAGFAFPGHTEFLAARLGAPEHAMMFAGPTLRVVLATIHLALRDVPAALTPAAIARAIFLGGAALARRFRVPAPRIGVLGLNPHAGEGGLFGREELDVVAPGILAGRARLEEAGIAAEVIGPLVPDAAFRQRCDLFVALYHDQGLIPVKLVDFESSVNVTLGLPIVRTSPDHGVAYDIAGQGVARIESFAAALDLAARLE